MEPFFSPSLPLSSLALPTPPAAPPPARGFAAHLARGLAVASSVASVAGQVLPGAGLVSVALGGLSRIIGGPDASAPNSRTLDALLDGQRSSNTQYLLLQSRMQQEARLFTVLSNIMKVRHDAMKNTLANIR